MEGIFAGRLDGNSGVSHIDNHLHCLACGKEMCGNCPDTKRIDGLEYCGNCFMLIMEGKMDLTGKII